MARRYFPLSCHSLPAGTKGQTGLANFSNELVSGDMSSSLRSPSQPTLGPHLFPLYLTTSSHWDLTPTDRSINLINVSISDRVKIKSEDWLWCMEEVLSLIFIFHVFHSLTLALNIWLQLSTITLLLPSAPISTAKGGMVFNSRKYYSGLFINARPMSVSALPHQINSLDWRRSQDLVKTDERRKVLVILMFLFGNQTSKIHVFSGH